MKSSTPGNGSEEQWLDQSRAKRPSSLRRAENGGVLYSSDPRDIGWVRDNVSCQTACPAGTNIPGYIQAIVEGQYGSSYEINRQANVLPGVLGRILPLAFLAPDIAAAILAGRRPTELIATHLKRLCDLPQSWVKQRRFLGFD